MRAWKYGLAVGFIVAFSVGTAVAFSWYFGIPTGAHATVTVADPSPDAVAAALWDAHAIDPWAGLLVRVLGRGPAGAGLHAGTFVVGQGAPLRQLFRDLSVQGRQELTVTVPEGSDLRDLAAILAKAGLRVTATDLYAVTGAPADAATRPTIGADAYPFLSGLPKGLSLEGYLFPDTYRLYADASPADAAKKMLDAFGAKTKDLRGKGLPAGLSSFHDALTLASIVEAEVRSPEDRRMVTDIFLRRLRAGMALQADSTVHYATGSSGKVSTTDAERATDSPWNTYKVRGLPPGPIANPGVEAIEAVLDPTPNPYVYFLTGTDGAVHYARTLEEQMANRKFLM